MASIQGVYLALFGRPADPLGLAFFNQATGNGANLTAIGDLASTAEYQTRFTGQSTTQIITSIYQSLFNRDPDLAGLTFFANALATGTLTINNIAIAIFDGAQGTDITTRDLKVSAANAFTAQIDTVAEINGYSGTAAADAGRAFIAGVTTTAPTEAQVTAAVATATTGTGQVGTTFPLTDAVDVLTGAGGNDVFIAALKGTAATLGAGDVLDGAGGTDRLNTFGNDNASAFATGNIKNIEQIFSQFTNAGALDVSKNTGVTQAWFANNSADASAITLTKTQTGGLEGAVGTTATFTFTDVGGTADSASLALNGATATTGVTVAGIETLSLSAVGKNSLGTLTAAATTKLVVTGAGSVSAVAAGGSFKTVDAAAQTGALTLDLAGLGAADHTITTGGANDEITIANLTKADTIDLGAGTDTLSFKASTTFNDAATAENLSKVSNVEVLKVVGATLTIDADLVSQTVYVADEDGGDLAISDAKANTTVRFLDGDFDASTVAMKLGVSTLAVELVGDKTDEANLTNGLTVTGSSTINVSSAGEAGVTGNVLALTAADNQSVVVTGAKDLTLTATAATGTTGFSIDASAFTGKLGVTGTAAADIIIGGSAVDSINGGNGADIMTGGAGGDTFTVGITAGAADAAGFTAALDTITDFTTKSDKLEFGAAAGSATNYLEAASAAADFTAALAAADTALNGTVLYSVQQVGSDTYVFYDADGTLDTANTEVVKLTGVSLTGIELGDIV